LNRKTCPRCGKDSYSAAVNSNWICPYCNKNLTNEPAKPASPKNKHTKDKKKPRQESRPPGCNLQGEQGAFFALIALEKKLDKESYCKKR